MTPTPTTIVLFGSFLHYSTLVAQAIHAHSQLKLLAVVSTPPRPSGRRHLIQPTHTHTWAQDQHLPVFTPAKLNLDSLKEIKQTINRSPDFILSCGYSKLIPKPWLEWPRLAPLNFHPSLLPKYPGCRPAEFALLCGEHQTGVTLHIMDDHYDTGPFVAQKSLPINDQDTRLTLYHRLYSLEAQMATDILPNWTQFRQFISPQDAPLALPYARALTRDDGFIPWLTLNALLNGQTPAQPMPLLTELDLPTAAATVQRAHRALIEFPGIWTKIPTTKGDKRLKLLELEIQSNRIVLGQVQLEGKQPSHFNHIKH